MRCVYFFVFFAVISGITSQDEDTSEYKCAVPPRDIIKNGKFKISGYGNDQPPAGQKEYSYVMEVTCDPGFTLRGSYLVSCYTDRSMNEFPKCIAPCQRKSPDVLSCGTGFDNEESQCLFSKQQENILTDRKRTDLQCGVIPQIFRATVSNGTEAKPEDAPWHATIYTKTTRPYMQICGGTIVSTNVVISAAHCFWDNTQKRLPAEQFAVAVGKIYRPWDDPNDTNPQKFEVKDIRIPPRFQGSTTNFQDDIAVLILDTEIVFGGVIVPACLDFDYDFDDVQIMSGRKGRVSGFGLTSADGAASQVLIWTELPVVDIEQCIATAEPGFIESITSDKICAGFANGTAVCRGDSGGGLLVPDDVDGSRRYFLRGVVSTAPPDDHLCNVFSVTTFTHIIRHERFIRNALDAAPQSQITTTQDPLDNFLSIGNPVDDFDKSNTPASQPSKSSTKPRDDEDDDANSKIPAANPLKNPKKPSPNKPTCDQLPDEEALDCLAKRQTTTSRYTIPEEIEKILSSKGKEVYSCEIGPNQTGDDCIKNTQKDKSTTKSDDTSSIGTEVITESAPITNPPPTLSNEENFGPDKFDEFGIFPTAPQDRPNLDNFNQGAVSQNGSNQEGLNQGELNQGISQGGLTQGVVFQEGLNQGGISQGGLSQGGISQGGLNQGEISQGGLSQGGISQGGLSQGGISQGGLSQGGISQGGISQGGLSQGGISQGGLSQGGMPQGGLSQGGMPQGGLSQGGISQGGLNQGGLSLGGLSQGGISLGGISQGGLNQGGTSQEGSNKGGISQGVLNQGGISQGGLNRGGLSQGGQSQGSLNQGGLNQQGNLNDGHQGTQNQIDINGQINQGINQNLAGQLGLHVGGLVQVPNERDKIQGVNQGLANQLGLNYGGIKQEVSYQVGFNSGSQAGINLGLGQSQSGIKVGGTNQGGISQGNLNQGGINQGGLNQGGINQGSINQGGISHGGINQQGLTQGFLIQPVTNGQVQESIHAGGLNQGPQTVPNQGGQIQGGINVGGHTYLPPQPIKKNGQIPIYPTLTPTVISVNVKPGPNVDIKPILAHPESTTERIDVKTSVLEQYFVTTEPNYEHNYQAQFWQYNSPHYQHDNQNYHHNNQNWQWQNWQQKEHDWQNWNPELEHKQVYPHGYYHHTNKYGGHWWQKYQK